MKNFVNNRTDRTSDGGYIMVWMVLLFSCMAIVSVVIFTSAQSSTISTDNQYKQQQAFYTAKSACLSTSDYVIKNVDDESIMEQLTSTTGTGSYDGMGTYSVNVSYVTTDRIKVIATSDFQGTSSTVSAYLITLPRPAGIIPTDNALFINGAGHNLNRVKIWNGDMYVNGDLYFSSDSTVEGSIVCDGILSISGGSLTTDSVFGFSSVFIGGGGKIGSITCKGDLELTGGASVQDFAYVQGSLKDTGSGLIYGNATIKNNVYFAGGSNKIRGYLYYGGTASTAWGSLSSFAPHSVYTTGYTAIDDSAYVAQELPIISKPTQTKCPSLYQTVVTNDVSDSGAWARKILINKSGTLTASTMSYINERWGTSVTIDCTNNDVFLLANNLDFKITSGANFHIKTDAAGKHNCYIFLEGTSTFTVNGQVYMGMDNPSSNPTPHLYIIGDKNSITMNSSSTINAVIYCPNGLLTMGGSSYQSNYKIIGCAIVGSVSTNGDSYFYYVPPDCEDTLLDIFSSGSHGDTAWKIESWGVN